MSGKKIIDGIAFSIEGLKRDADEIEACGGGNEAAQMRWAAAALSEAQATIARQQVMLDRALESNGDMQAEIARLRGLVPNPDETRDEIVWRDYMRGVHPDTLAKQHKVTRERMRHMLQKITERRAALEAKHG